MKQLVKKALSRVAKNNLTWFFLSPLHRLGLFLFRAHSGADEEHLDGRLEKKLFSTLIVQNGAFKGMKYPRLDSVCSSIYPKLLGSYEHELADTIAAFSKKKYSDIIDIGCAEGYYAVGFAMKIPKATVHAYDTDEKARALCSEMATLNGVANRVIVRAACTAETLASFPFSGRGLVVCDCEGFEKELFTKSTVKNLQQCDLIIEAHDLIDIEISTYLKKIFSQTHEIKSVKSIDDIEKAHTYEFDELKHIPLLQKKFILEERRESIMEWLICTPKV